MAKRTTENIPHIPHLPGGWRPTLFGQSQREPRQGVVVCQGLGRDGTPDGKWVCWRVNMVEGGCYLGHYKRREQDACAVFDQRFAELQRRDTPAAMAPVQLERRRA